MVQCPFCHNLCKSEFGLHCHVGRVHREIVGHTCFHCSVVLTIENQRPSDIKRKLHICITCYRTRQRRYATNDPERYKQMRQKSIAKLTTEKKENYKIAQRQANAARSQRLRREVIDAYGGCCECCGETHIEFLTIDHRHGDGASDHPFKGKSKRSRASGTFLYYRLKRQDFPKDLYRLLCFNCNCSLGHLGYCPHQTQLELFAALPRLSRGNRPLPLAAD